MEGKPACPKCGKTHFVSEACKPEDLEAFKVPDVKQQPEQVVRHEPPPNPFPDPYTRGVVNEKDESPQADRARGYPGRK